MANRLEDYREQYEQLFKDCQIIGAGKQQQVDKAIAAMQAHQARYAALADQLGIPWYFIAVVHQREASGNFSRSMRDGHRLPAGLSSAAAGTTGAWPACSIAWKLTTASATVNIRLARPISGVLPLATPGASSWRTANSIPLR
ncbi:MAG: hypothetical protein M1438_07285 [Deltaproteobacteria bacterium]|nr:hypothetical protein [Deltaproteobacteria bacterium]